MSGTSNAANSTPTQNVEAKELSLVGKVELRIALADSDSKLESLLQTYLPPLLLKLASDYSSVRNKVIAVCQHINTRIQLPSIQLPVARLLTQFKDNQNSLIRHFDLLYIQQGIERLSKEEKSSLHRPLLHGIHLNYEESTLQTAKLFNIFLRILNSLNLPARGSEDDSAIRTQLGLSDSIEDAKFVASWLGKLMLFSPNHVGEKRCPGLGKTEYGFLNLHDKEDIWRLNASGGLNLTETKVLAARFLASGAFVDSERFLPALFASADKNPLLSEIGSDIMKRSIVSISLEDHQLLGQLFQVYLGTGGSEGAPPSPVPLQIKILGLFSKSNISSSFIEQSIQIIQQGLMPAESTRGDGLSIPSKLGLETSKLRVKIFAFANWLAKTSPPSSIEAFALPLVSQLRGHIEHQGWPQLHAENSRPNAFEAEARGYCYESIGLLAAACPNLVLLQPDVDLVRWLFTSLSTDSSGTDVSSSIEQALGSILGAFGQDLDWQVEKSLVELLSQHMILQPEEEDALGHRVIRSTQFIALRFANRCLPYSNVTARLINIQALKDESNGQRGMKDEGKKGLHPYWYKMWNPIREKESSTTVNQSKQFRRYQFPNFEEIVEKFFGPAAEWNIQKLDDTQPEYSRAYGAALAFCRSVLLNQALSSTQKAPKINAEWEQNITALVSSDEESRTHLKVFLEQGFLTQGNLSRALETYVAAAFYGIISCTSGDFHEPGECLLEICSLAWDPLLDGPINKISKLDVPIFSNHQSLRETAAHVFGILASRSRSSPKTVHDMLQNFERKIQNWSQAIGEEINKAHGAILATAFFVSRASCRGTIPASLETLRSKFIDLILDILVRCADKMLCEAAMVAFSELGLFAVLSLHTNLVPAKLASLVEALNKKAKSGNEIAIITLGNIATQCEESQGEGADLKQIIDILYSLHEVRKPEVQFAVGASLSCAAAGWQSKALIAALDIPGPPPRSCDRNTTLRRVIDKVLADCKNTKPALRQAAVIWLLCLIQYCGHKDDTTCRLRECQSAFVGFLADRDPVNQESASRGLTLIYEKGDKSLKNNLIQDLVASFTGSRTNLAGTVSEETELFEPGALPTGEGSVMTYKDIMSLASEVGDPGLVYKFMSLASHNAIWSSRAAFGRFGLSDILADSSEDGYLAQNPKIYPALFRYRFDPSPNVRASMNEIWSALAKDPTSVIDVHFDDIVRDLLKNILGREWRVRQASCAAIANLLQGRPFENYQGYLIEIWTKAFQVCDDIKDSVRLEALNLVRALTGTLTRTLQAGEFSSRNAVAMLEKVIPFLLSPSGLESNVQELQSSALHTLLEIIKHSRSTTLRPFIPDIACHLLALLSSVEPGILNYAHLNADNYNIKRDELDDARLMMIKGSPMMEAIERCLDFVDDATMAALCPRLEETMHTVIGLPSKVGVTYVLVSLSTRHSFLFKAYADRFIGLVRKHVLDRNDTISSAFAVACGYLARLASDEEILKLYAYCQQRYLDSDEDRQRKISGEIIHAVSKHAADRFKSVASEVLPFCFVAKHDLSQYAKPYFQDSWNEHVAGSRAVLLYLPEITSLIMRYLDSPRWSIKHTSALALADLIKSLGDKINDSDAKSIWPILEKAVGGKAWVGKETVLESLVRFAKFGNIMTWDEKVARTIETIMLRESKRNNLVYRRHALACLKDFLEIHTTTVLYAEVYGIAEPIVEEILDGSSMMDVDGAPGGPSAKSIMEGTLASAMASLLSAIKPQLQNPSDLAQALTQVFDLANRVRSTDGNRYAADAIYDGYRKLFERIALSAAFPASGELENVLLQHAQTFFNHEGGVEETRLKAAEAATALAAVAKRRERVKIALLNTIAARRANERSTVVQQSLDQAEKKLEEE